jgi:AP endonuclease-1
MRDPRMAGIPLILETPPPNKATGLTSTEPHDKLEIELLYRIQAMEDEEWEEKKAEIEGEWRKKRDSMMGEKKEKATKGGKKAKAKEAKEPKSKGKGKGKGKGKKGKEESEDDEDEGCDSCSED